MTKKELIELGFTKIPHFTITDSLIYELSRNRHISVGSIGTPNEMVWLCQTNYKDKTNITDLVCLHNYDYDGYITEDKIKKIISIF